MTSAEIKSAVLRIISEIPRRRGDEDDVWNLYAQGKARLLPFVDGSDSYDWAIALLINRLGI